MLPHTHRPRNWQVRRPNQHPPRANPAVKTADQLDTSSLLLEKANEAIEKLKAEKADLAEKNEFILGKAFELKRKNETDSDFIEKQKEMILEMSRQLVKAQQRLKSNTTLDAAMGEMLSQHQEMMNERDDIIDMKNKQIAELEARLAAQTTSIDKLSSRLDQVEKDQVAATPAAEPKKPSVLSRLMESTASVDAKRVVKKKAPVKPRKDNLA